MQSISQQYLNRIKLATIELKNNPLYLDDLKFLAENDTELDDSEKTEVIHAIIQAHHNYISANGIGDIPISNNENNTNDGTARPERVFPRYSFLDDALAEEMPCGLTENRRNEYDFYPHWLLREYLPKFHPIINAEVQYPVIACTMLLNSMAAKPNTKFPMMWISGLAGTGKSELGKAYLMHYPPSLRVEMRPEDTGASLRDRLDARFGDGSPGILLADNFWIKESLQRLATFRSIILANCRQDAESHLSTKGDNAQGTFRTHCFKVFTSVDDGKEGATSEFSEIARRLWVVSCSDTGAKPPSRDLFTWDKAQAEYQSFWGHEAREKIRDNYVKIFAKVARTKSDKIPFDMKIWEMLIPAIATYAYVGLGTIDEGIEVFRRHREWTLGQNTANVDAILQAVKAYLSQQNADIEAQLEIERKHPFSAMKPERIEDLRKQLESKIDPGHLKNFIENALDQKINGQNFEKIIQIMTGYKYLYQVKQGKGVFVKQ